MRIRFATIAFCAGLAACGGGGGGGGDDGGGGVATPLSADNYVAVAKEGIAPAVFMMNTRGSIVGVQASDPGAIFRFVRAQLPKLAGWVSSATPQATGVAYTDTYPCAGGGYMTITVDDANNSGLVDAGDSVSITFNSCSEEGAVMNGTLAFVVDAITGVVDLPPYSMSVTATLQNLTMVFGTGSETANGSFTLDLDVPTYDTSYSSMLAPSMTTTAIYGEESVTRTLTNYALSASEVLGASTLVASGTVTTSVLSANPLTVSTPVTFNSLASEDYPSSGQMLLSAALGGKVRVTALAGGSAYIELDANDDGVYETTTTLPWSELI